MTKKAQILDLRNQGLDVKVIADMVGVSVCYVYQICQCVYPRYYSPIGNECIYPNLRKWMNKHKVSRKEFLLRMGLTAHQCNYQKFTDLMQGKYEPRKNYIDKMLEVTGLTYEELFKTEDEDGM
jgi:hypothetical protein